MNAKPTLESYLLAVIRGERTGWKAQLIRLGLSGLELVYNGALTVKCWITRKRQLPVPVISIGNITAGGTGKTPTVVWLAETLIADGLRPAILTRGYGGTLQKTGKVFTSRELSGLSSAETGDEPYLLAKLLPGICIAVGRERYEMGLRALQRDSAIDVFILDDGFQYWSLKRNLDIVLLDAANPFDNRHLLPRGLLREPPRALQRAQVVVLTRIQQVNQAGIDQIVNEVKRHNPTAVIAEAHAVNSTVTPLENWTESTVVSIPAASFLNGRRIGILTAIGNPEQLRRTMQDLGAEIVRFEVFPDHHAWNETEVQELSERLKAERVSEVVATGKDAVKLLPYQAYFLAVQIRCYLISLEFKIDDQAVSQQIKKVVERLR